MILKPINNLDAYTSKAEAVIGVFGSRKWLLAYGDALTVIGIYKDEHQLIGGFYFLKTKKYGFTFLKLPPYTPHCGLFFISESKNKASVNNFSKEVMTAVSTFFLEQQSAITILAFPSELIDLQPFIWNKFKVIPNYTYRIDLQASLDEISRNFDTKNRNTISKALKEGAETAENKLTKQQLLDFFLARLKTTNANIYEEELRSVLLQATDLNNSFSMEAYKEDALLGAVFCVFDQKACYYLFGGVNKEAGFPGINNLLIQKSIEKARLLGCRLFDFEGSMLKGVEKFFRSFGPELVPYYTVNKALLPLELILKFKKRELF